MEVTFPGIFRTVRLVLRPVELADAGPIFASYAQDPEVTRFLTWRPHGRIEETLAYVSRCMEAVASRTYVITERSDAAVAGAFDLRIEPPGRVSIGYVLARQCWGQGLMTEALTEVAGWCLGQPGIWRVGGMCDVENPASGRVMVKAGLVREGILRRWIIHPNVSPEPRDCISYARVR